MTEQATKPRGGRSVCETIVTPTGHYHSVEVHPCIDDRDLANAEKLMERLLAGLGLLREAERRLARMKR